MRALVFRIYVRSQYVHGYYGSSLRESEVGGPVLRRSLKSLPQAVPAAAEEVEYRRIKLNAFDLK